MNPPDTANGHVHTLEDLEREQLVLKPLQHAVPYAWNVLDAEVQRLKRAGADGTMPGETSRGTIAPTPIPVEGLGCVTTSHDTSPGGRPGVKKRIRIDVDQSKAPPNYNFVGRILGPRGATLKTLEKETGCKIMIRGKGSIRKDKEEEMRGKAGWEHVFEEELHIICEADHKDEMAQLRALKRAKDAIELLLVPVPDEKDSLKRQQLRDLAILNGTYRHPSSHYNGYNHAMKGSDSRALHHQIAPPALAGIDGGRTISPAHLAQSMQAHQNGYPALHAHHHSPLQSTHPSYRSPHSSTVRGHSNHSPAFQLTPLPTPLPSAPIGSSGLANDFERLNISTAASGTDPTTPEHHSRKSHNLRLPDFPTLDLDALNDPPASEGSSLSGLNPMPVPLASPTIVDPELYPFPRTPSVMSTSESGFGSPIWSSPGLPRSNSAHAGTSRTSESGSFGATRRNRLPGGRMGNFGRSASFGTPNRSSTPSFEEFDGVRNSSHLDGEPVRSLRPGDRSLSSSARIPSARTAQDGGRHTGSRSGGTPTAAFDSLFPSVMRYSTGTGNMQGTIGK